MHGTINVKFMSERLYGDERCENIARMLLRTVTEYLAHTLVRNMSWLRSRCYKLANTKARWETTSLLHDIRSSVFHTHTLPKHLSSPRFEIVYCRQCEGTCSLHDSIRAEFPKLCSAIYEQVLSEKIKKTKIIDFLKIKFDFSTFGHILRYC